MPAPPPLSEPVTTARGHNEEIGKVEGVGKRHAEKYALDCCVRYAASVFGDVL